MITAEAKGRMVNWHYDVGALVEAGALLAEIDADGELIPVCAPADGRLTEMMALPGDNVEAGGVIGWLDAVAGFEKPQPLSELLDQPVERKLKPRRKSHPLPRPTTRFWVLLGLVVALGIGALLGAFLIVPVNRSSFSAVTVQPVAPRSERPMPLPMPTPKYRLMERVILREPVGEIQWGAQGVIQDTGYEPESGTWYEVKFGEEIIRVPETRLDSVGVLAPTPTMRFDFRGWDWSYTLMLREPVADFPVGTRVTIGSATFNGVEWELYVTTLSGTPLTVRESQLEIPPDAMLHPPMTATPAPPWQPAASPTAGLMHYMGSDGYPLLTTAQIGNVPANTRVRIINMRLEADGWLYTVVAEGRNAGFEAHESQLVPAP